CASRLFFFQAEDGIRDFHVTGVQTCALPILSTGVPTCTENPASSMMVVASSTDLPTTFGRSFITRRVRLRSGSGNWSPPYTAFEIGRASCREGESVWVGSVSAREIVCRGLVQ